MRHTIAVQNRLEPHRGIVASRAIWALLEQFAWPIALLACMPVLVSRLGASNFGLFSLTLTVCGMSSLLAIGVGALTTRNVVISMDNKDPEGSVLAVRSALGALVICGGLICLVTAALTPILVVAMFASMGSTELTTFALLAGLGCALIQEIDTVFSMAIKGRERFRLAAILEWAGRTFWALASVSAVIWGDLVLVMVATVAAMLLKCLLKAVAAITVFGTSYIIIPLATLQAIRPLLSASRWLWIQNLSGLLLMSADRLIVGSLFGSAAIGRYTACAQLAQFAFIVPATAGQALLPWAMGHLASKTRPKGGWHANLLIMGISSSLGGLVIAVFSYQILAIWLGPAFAAENALLLSSLSIGGSILAFSIPYHYVQLAAGKTRLIGVVNALGAVGFIGTGLMAAPYGLVAFAIAKSAYAIPMMTYFFKFPDPRQIKITQSQSC